MYPYRKQLSLTIKDTDLFENFIKPSGQELNSIIIKCLSAYYYNPEVRGIIEGEDTHIDGETNRTSTQDTINEIRQALAMQSFYADSMKDELESGMSDISEVLTKSTEMAEQSGFAKEETDATTGSKILRITANVPQTATSSDDFRHLQEAVIAQATKGNYTEAFNANTKVQNELNAKLDKIIALLGGGELSDEEKQAIAFSLGGVTGVSIPSEPELPDEPKPLESPEPMQVEEIKEELPINVTEEDDEEDDAPVDATSKMGDLLGSLGF